VTQLPGKKLRMVKENTESTTRLTHIRTFLIPINLSPPTDKSLEKAQAGYL